MPRFRKRHDRKPRYGGASKRDKRRRGEPEGVRLQKVLAAAGLGSRRQCEELIRDGRVDVDGETVTELGTRVDPGRQQVRVDGQQVRRPRNVYFLVNKPVGVLSTNYDPAGRPRVVDLAPSHQRMFTVGRLDKSSEGLILVTNDGQLTDLLTHPRYGVEKTYLAVVVGVPKPETLAKLQRGVRLAEGFAHAKRVHVRKAHKQSAVLEIVLDEGRNREVRRLLARFGHKVLSLRRIGIGPLRLGNLKRGESRPLQRDEIDELYRAAQERRRAKPKGASKPLRDTPISADSNSQRPAEVHPLIDQSLPADEGGEVAGFEEQAPIEERAHIDFSPIAPGGKARAKRRTIIGGAQQGGRRQGRQRGRGAGGRRNRP